MKKSNYLAVLLSFIMLTAFTTAHVQLKISNGYFVKFSTEKASGKFDKISGTINFDENDLTNSSFNVEVEVESISTGNFLKTSHAKGSNWFESDKYPKISFVSNKISKSNNGYLVDGNLTIKDITKSIQIPFNFNNNTFSGTFSINRMDYKIGSMEGMSKNVGNKVDLQISVPVTK